MSLPYQWTSRMIRRGWLRVLTALELATLLALGEFIDHESGETWVSTDKVGDLIGRAPSTVYDALGRLRKRGLLRSELRERERRYRRYAVMVHTLVEIPEIPPAPPVEKYVPEFPEDAPGVRGAIAGEDVPGNQDDTPPEVVAGETGQSPETQDRTFTPQNGESPHLERILDTLSDQYLQRQKTDQINALHAERNGAQEHPLTGLARLVSDFMTRPSEDQIAALVKAGGSGKWTEVDVLRCVRERFPEEVRA